MNGPTDKIPLFIYWHQGWTNAPAVVLKCKLAWERHHGRESRYQVKPICSETLEDWLYPCPESEVKRLKYFSWRIEQTSKAGSLAFFTDLLRLLLIEAHGGIWIDATVYCLQPLDFWIPPSNVAQMPLSLSPDRLFEVWFIDNRAKDKLISKWKQQLLSKHFDLKNYTTYIDDWSTKPHQLTYWLLQLSSRSWILSGIIWNSRLTTKWLKLRPYFMVNYAQHKVITTPEYFITRHSYILPIDLKAMTSLELFDDITSHQQAQQLLSRAPFVKLSHKKDWACENTFGLSIKSELEQFCPLE